jgi:hypothetical protein
MKDTIMSKMYYLQKQVYHTFNSLILLTVIKIETRRLQGLIRKSNQRLELHSLNKWLLILDAH